MLQTPLDVRCTPVRALMTEHPVTALGETPIVQIRRMMAERRIRHMPIVGTSGKPIGLIAERDLLLRGDGAHKARAIDLLQSFPVVRDDACSASAARFMLLTKIDALLVCDDAGKLVGILTDADYLRAVVRGGHVGCGPGATIQAVDPRHRTTVTSSPGS
jgi:CBS domain-containing protein